MIRQMIRLQKADPIKIIRYRFTFDYFFQTSIAIFFIFPAALTEPLPKNGKIAVQIFAHTFSLTPHAGKNRRLFFIAFIPLLAQPTIVFPTLFKFRQVLCQLQPVRRIYCQTERQVMRSALFGASAYFFQIFFFQFSALYGIFVIAGYIL